MTYRKRFVDEILERKLKVFGAVLITGPKGCGKTTTAKQKAKSVVEFQDEDLREGYLSVASTTPSKLLVGERPRLFDEWQDAPKIWGTIRKSIDDTQLPGQFILTGSSSQTVNVPHTGTLRISRLQMYPMSLFESGESNGEVSLMNLFDHPETFDGCISDLDIDGLIQAICRGGWPTAINIPEKDNSLLVAKDLFEQTCLVDASNVDGVKRNPEWVKLILRSYSRNICQPTDNKTILADIYSNTNISEVTYYDYIQALEKLYIVSDVEAWCPAIRSKSAIRSSKKKNLIDPSIAVAAMNIGPNFFNTDFRTLGFLFESLCIRDLKAYSSAHGGTVSYYRDRYGLEADLVLHLDDGRYALCEIKLGQSEIDEGAKHLLKIEELVKEHNKTEKQMPIRLPDLKIVITGTKYGYRREDGVLVIPIGCLRD
ncbi:MAG: DUF4143 domain-containing protein [archaeon]|nr:DUF4143 domain-containing protein [archaeon]